MKQPGIVRLLQIVAVGLAIAIVGLGIAWLGRDPIAPIAVSEVAGNPAPEAAELRVAAVADADEAPRHAAVESAAARPEDRPDVPAAAGAVLYGSIRTAEGELVDQGVMWAYRQIDRKLVGTCSLRNGTFVFPGLSPGAHRLATRIDDELPLDRLLDVAAPRTRVDLSLPACWRLMVHTVTPDGEPLREAGGARVKRFGWDRALSAYASPTPLAGDLPPTHQSMVAGGLGVFRSNDFFADDVLPKSAIGVLALPVDGPVTLALLMRNVLLDQQQVSPGQTEATFILSVDDVLARTATVRMRIVDERGAPIAGAHVSMTDAQTGSIGQPTGEDGRVVLENLQPGRLDLSIRHSTRCGPPVLIDVPSGAELDLGDVTLRPMVQVAFSFEEFGGEGGIRAAWLDSPPDPDWRVDQYYFSAANGRLLTYGLFPGRYFLLAQSDGRLAHMTLDTRAVGAEPVRFRFDDGAPLRVRGDVGDAPRLLTIMTTGGGLVHSSEIQGPIDRQLTLPVGDYVAELTGGSTPVRRTIALRAGGAELSLP